MSETFYGGLPGVSFIIRAFYKNTDAMKEAVTKEDCPVGYGEYMIISNDNLSHPENGQLFMRDYNETTGCKYIGNISGPKGESPTIYLKEIEDSLNKGEEHHLIADEGEEKSGVVYNIHEKTVKVNDIFTHSALKNQNVTYKQATIKSTDSNKASETYIDLRLPYYEPTAKVDYKENLTKVEGNEKKYTANVIYTHGAPDENGKITNPLTGNFTFELPHVKADAITRKFSENGNEIKVETTVTSYPTESTKTDNLTFKFIEATANNGAQLQIGNDTNNVALDLNTPHYWELSDDGKLNFYTTTTTASTPLPNNGKSIKWIKDIKQIENGALQIYLNGDTETEPSFTTSPAITSVVIRYVFPYKIFNAWIQENYEDVLTSDNFEGAGAAFLGAVKQELMEGWILKNKWILSNQELILQKLDEDSYINLQHGLIGVDVTDDPKIKADTIFYYYKEREVSLNDDGDEYIEEGDWVSVGALGSVEDKGTDIYFDTTVSDESTTWEDVQFDFIKEGSICYLVEDIDNEGLDYESGE